MLDRLGERLLERCLDQSRTSENSLARSVGPAAPVSEPLSDVSACASSNTLEGGVEAMRLRAGRGGGVGGFLLTGGGDGVGTLRFSSEVVTPQDV